MPDGGHHSLTRKAIKRPTQDDVKPTLVRIVKHSREFGPLILAFGAADAIDILVHNLVPSTGAPLPQLKQLVVGVLIPAIGDAPHAMIDRSGPHLRKWTALIDDGPCSSLFKGCCSGGSSRRPLRPSALPAPRPRIAVRPLSSCGSRRPCCAKLLIADPRNRIEEIVMHGNWKGLVLLLNEDRNQILSLALVRHSP